MTVGAHIVVVDDDEDVRSTAGEYLLRNGFDVSQADGGAALRELMAVRPVDLVLLYIHMPGEDGLTLAREIRRCGPAGIIMLTASQDDIDKVVGLDLGADDYVTKPFNPRELLARIRAVLRRVAVRPEPPATMGEEVRIGRCRLGLDRRKLFDASGGEVSITSMEFDLLAALISRPGRVLSRDQLLELAHHKEMEPFDRSIDTRITRLRRKVEVDPAKPSAIKTVRGQGYVFEPGAYARAGVRYCE